MGSTRTNTLTPPISIVRVSESELLKNQYFIVAAITTYIFSFILPFLLTGVRRRTSPKRTSQSGGSANKSPNSYSFEISSLTRSDYILYRA